MEYNKVNSWRKTSKLVFFWSSTVYSFNKDENFPNKTYVLYGQNTRKETIFEKKKKKKKKEISFSVVLYWANTL